MAASVPGWRVRVVAATSGPRGPVPPWRISPHEVDREAQQADQLERGHVERALPGYLPDLHDEGNSERDDCSDSSHGGRPFSQDHWSRTGQRYAPGRALSCLPVRGGRLRTGRATPPSGILRAASFLECQQGQGHDREDAHHHGHDRADVEALLGAVTGRALLAAFPAVEAPLEV